MFGRRIVGLGLLALLICGLLTISGLGTYRAGWSQGYVNGSIAAGGEEGAAAPLRGYGPGYGYGFGPWPFFFGIGLFFKFGLLLLLFLMFAKFLSFGFWRMAGGPKGKYWAKHRHRWGYDESLDDDEHSDDNGIDAEG